MLNLLGISMIKTTVAERTGRHTSNSIISTAGELELMVYVYAAVQMVFELEEWRDGGCYNCWFNVDIVLVTFSCRQSWTVYCVEAFVSDSWHPIMCARYLHAVCVSILSFCHPVFLSWIGQCPADRLSVTVFVCVLCLWSWSCHVAIWLYIAFTVSAFFPSPILCFSPFFTHTFILSVSLLFAVPSASCPLSKMLFSTTYLQDSGVFFSVHSLNIPLLSLHTCHDELCRFLP